MNILEQHLTQEVNIDEFQFERMVHYHVDDIFNYFNAYKLAKKNNVNIGDTWLKINGFLTHTKIIDTGKINLRLPTDVYF